MSSTCFETEGSSSGRQLYIEIRYGVFYMHQYKRSCGYKFTYTFRKFAFCCFMLCNYKENCSDWLLLSSCIGCRLHMMRRVGILDRIYRKFAFKLPPTTDNTTAVDLRDTAPHFIILASGIAISLHVFVAYECAVRCAHAQS